VALFAVVVAAGAAVDLVVRGAAGETVVAPVPSAFMV